MEWFIYLLKASACTALFLGFYLLFLKKLTFFKMNRFYLLFTLLISLVIPAFRITIQKEPDAAQLANTTPVMSVSPSANLQQTPSIRVTPAPVSKKFNWQAAAILVYSTVAFALIFSGLLAFRQLYCFIKRSGQNINQFNGMKLIPKKSGFTNCSFFNYVFIDENAFTSTELQFFLRHEEAHVKQYHSIDNILMLLAKATLWFNPVIYMYCKELEQAHEYEADAISSQNFGVKYYANLLLNVAVAKSQPSLAHHFAKSPVKSRIKMLFNPKSNNMKKTMYLLPLLMSAGMIFLFGVHFVYAQLNPIPATLSREEITKTQPATKKDSLQTIPSDTIPASKKTTSEAQKDSILDISVPTPGKAELAVQIDSVQVVPNQGTVSLNAGERRSGTRRLTAEGSIIEDENGCRVTRIECDEKNTIISFEYTAPYAGSWVLLNKEMYLQSSNDMKHFQYIKSEGIPLMPNKHYFEKAGDKLAFKVYFEKVPQTARWIDIIERAGRSNYFNFYNVSLPPSYYAAK